MNSFYYLKLLKGRTKINMNLINKQIIAVTSNVLLSMLSNIFIVK